MSKEYILFIDSGIGGFSIFSNSLVNNKGNYIYYADNIHCPYGSHTKKEIYNYLKKIILKINSKYLIKTIVLACNTATTSSIEKLRRKFKNINFIGTEPAIGLLKKNNINSALIIATPATIKQKKYKNLVHRATNIKIKSLPLENFAFNIENYFLNNSLINKYNILKNIFLIKKKSKNYQSIVLGCTHYVLVKKLLKKYIDKIFFDGTNGITNLIKSNYNSNNKKNKIIIMVSKNDNKQKEKYIKILKQILANNKKIC